MKKKLGLLSLVVLSIFLMAGSAGAVSLVPFDMSDLGVEITLKDGISNSTYISKPNIYKVGSPAFGIAGEDDETERYDEKGLNTLTDQQWDLEGMFWNTSSKTLSIVGGFDYLNGVAKESIGDLFIGDGCVLDFQRNGSNLKESGTYGAISGGFNTLAPHAIKPSGPYLYKDGGYSTKDPGNYQVTMGIDVGDYFSDWEGTAAVKVNGSVHHLLQIFATDAIADLINSGELMHLTLSCGNDTIHGAAPVPEPATVLLLGTGLLGVGIFSRRRKRQAV